ncbi:hypothetical protein PRZ48_009001 [Zasmidium cellare]|uniref:Uncharacterized protein n=1 Tax=Zasmidium cellare TaxID=395010 RepID=A0ABR0EH25_ZASCE|nr:hypothetical protein PRZ48_009001 [Zasmidium cellare]
MESQVPNKTGFGDLPRELRDKIYAIMLAKDATVVRQCYTNKFTSCSGILLANKRINTEFKEAMRAAYGTIPVLMHDHVYIYHDFRHPQDPLFQISNSTLTEATKIPREVTRLVTTLHMNRPSFKAPRDGHIWQPIPHNSLLVSITSLIRALHTSLDLKYLVINVQISNATLEDTTHINGFIYPILAALGPAKRKALRAVVLALPGFASRVIALSEGGPSDWGYAVGNIGEDDGCDELMRAVRAPETAKRDTDIQASQSEDHGLDAVMRAMQDPGTSKRHAEFQEPQIPDGCGCSKPPPALDYSSFNVDERALLQHATSALPWIPPVSVRPYSEPFHFSPAPRTQVQMTTFDLDQQLRWPAIRTDVYHWPLNGGDCKTYQNSWNYLIVLAPRTPAKLKSHMNVNKMQTSFDAHDISYQWTQGSAPPVELIIIAVSAAIPRGQDRIALSSHALMNIGWKAAGEIGNGPDTYIAISGTARKYVRA